LLLTFYTHDKFPVSFLDLATGLLQEASGRVLRMRDALDVRDSLCLQLVLGNAKRGGDITHIRAEGSRSRKDTGNLS
jgi:hypothetical protein